MHRSFLFLILFLGPLHVTAQESRKIDTVQLVMNELLFEEAQRVRIQKPDTAIYLLQLCYKNFILQGDTSQAINVLSELAETYGHQAHYKKSYDELWKALLLADKSNNLVAKAMIYRRIGRYYSFFKRKEEALKYFQLSLGIDKQLVADKVLEEKDLAINYYAFCATYRELGEPKFAQVYLDSSYMFSTAIQSEPDPTYLRFEQAFLLGQFGKNEEALSLFHEIIPWFQKHHPSYLVLVYAYTGDTYRELGNFTESESYYKQALEISNAYHSHIDFSPILHGKLSDLYNFKGDYRQAYYSLKAMKELDEKFFDSRSENNRPLLEIQDAFRKEKENRKQLLQEQRLARLENEEKVLFLQRTILLVSILFIILIGLIYLNNIRSKHRAEKQLIRKKRELEIEKTNEILELKNKELAASALQLIERDELLVTLKNKLKEKNGNLSAREVKQILRSISINNTQNWEDFRTRFVAVNKRFYQHLSEKFPNLTQGDQKLCALIKLNFTSKEMSKFLGISIESVHTTRYRLRRKLALTRDVNLTEFISGL